MNLLLLEPGELGEDGRARLLDRRLQHVREILKLEVGDRLRAGIVGGRMGEAEVEALTPSELVLRVEEATEAPPPRPGVDLVLGMPRPRALKRILSNVAQLGVDRVVLLNANRVERSYFSSPALEPEAIRRELLEGLEQARDTVLPEVLIRDRFRPFVEDEVDRLYPSTVQRLLAHPEAAHPLEALPRAERRLIAVGPEGGWVPFELELLEKNGFLRFSLGERIQRTETLIPYLMGALRR